MFIYKTKIRFSSTINKQTLFIITMEKENRIFDDYIDEELKNIEEEDSSIIDELKEELEEMQSETKEDAGESVRHDAFV